MLCMEPFSSSTKDLVGRLAPVVVERRAHGGLQKRKIRHAQHSRATNRTGRLCPPGAGAVGRTDWIAWATGAVAQDLQFHGDAGEQREQHLGGDRVDDGLHRRAADEPE